MSEETATLGQRLADQARRLPARPALVMPWAAPFAVLLDHLAELPSPEAGRFTRREVAVAEQAWPNQAVPNQAVPNPAHGWGGPAASPPAWGGRPLPSDVVTRLRAAVGPGVEAMRVHDDDAADETARAHRADAVTVGSDVFFRQGQLNPREPRGFGLLVHEATHVVERLRPGASWRGATAGAGSAEENLAVTREVAVLAGEGPAPEDSHVPHSPHMSTPPAIQYPAAPLPSPAGVPPAAPAAPLPPLLPPLVAPPVAPVAPAGGTPPVAAPVATAAVDRSPSRAPAPAGIDVDALRGRIMRDLMRQLRDEFERGG